ncbi:GNAT family N-acetyltransferase [Chitinimonas sp.]|uniref:GNAT family N-acetyltransferase n=1 Tax=Chitinimonas sp. TaxID=1934313 RepID=UPI002F93A9EB
MRLRALTVADHLPIRAVMNEWWGGRQVDHLLHRFLFEHFGDSSLFAETAEGELAGFLVGFLSQTQPDVAYVHFIGVAPSARGSGLGRTLYQAFMAHARLAGRTRIKAITSPVNHASVAFHLSLGFRLAEGDATVNDYPVISDHGGPGQARICFEIDLKAAHEAADQQGQ